MIHSADKIERRSEEARKMVGPEYDGLMVKVTLRDGAYAGSFID